MGENSFFKVGCGSKNILKESNFIFGMTEYLAVVGQGQNFLPCRLGHGLATDGHNHKI